MLIPWRTSPSSPPPGRVLRSPCYEPQTGWVSYKHLLHREGSRKRKPPEDSTVAIPTKLPGYLAVQSEIHYLPVTRHGQGLVVVGPTLLGMLSTPLSDF